MYILVYNLNASPCTRVILHHRTAYICELFRCVYSLNAFPFNFTLWYFATNVYELTKVLKGSFSRRNNVYCLIQADLKLHCPFITFTGWSENTLSVYCQCMLVGSNAVRIFLYTSWSKTTLSVYHLMQADPKLHCPWRFSPLIT